MHDCTYYLYKALLKRFPYTPSSDTEYAAEKLEQIEGHIDGLPDPCQINMIELLDCTEALAVDRSCHAFQLGLDVGLSIAQEARSLQTEL